MSKLEIIRNKLDKKLFNTNAVLRSDVTIYTYTEGSASFGGYSDADATYSSGTVYAGVPYNNIPKQFSVQPFGDLQEGDMFLVVRYDTPLEIKDKVSFNSITYFVQQVKEIPINNGIAAKIAQIRRQH